MIQIKIIKQFWETFKKQKIYRKYTLLVFSKGNMLSNNHLTENCSHFQVNFRLIKNLLKKYIYSLYSHKCNSFDMSAIRFYSPKRKKKKFVVQIKPPYDIIIWLCLLSTRCLHSTVVEKLNYSGYVQKILLDQILWNNILRKIFLTWLKEKNKLKSLKIKKKWNCVSNNVHRSLELSMWKIFCKYSSCGLKKYSFFKVNNNNMLKNHVRDASFIFEMHLRISNCRLKKEIYKYK